MRAAGQINLAPDFALQLLRGKQINRQFGNYARSGLLDGEHELLQLSKLARSAGQRRKPLRNFADRQIYLTRVIHSRTRKDRALRIKLEREDAVFDPLTFKAGEVFEIRWRFDPYGRLLARQGKAAIRRRKADGKSCAQRENVQCPADRGTAFLCKPSALTAG